MDESPELPPLKRGAYDIDAILAAAGDAEFAIPPPASKTSFNANPFASSSPASFRASQNSSSSSSTPSINNSPYPTPANDEDYASASSERPQASARKPLASTTRKRVSNLKSTLNKFAAPRRTDLEPPMENSTTDDFMDNAGVIGNVQDQVGIGHHKSNGFGLNDDLHGDPAAVGTDREDQFMDSKRNTLDSGHSPDTSMVRGRRSRPFRSFNRVASPAGNTSLLDATGTSSPSRASSPVNISSNSLAPNDLAVTPSSSRPTSRPTSRSNSRPTSRPSSRVSNGKYQSRQLSPDSLNSFNVMMDKEDLDDDDELNRSGHMSFVVSDPEHRRILEGEIEDPFSPSMSVIDPDADAYLSSLMQQTSPFGSIKSNSRGQSPAYRNRRLRQTEAGDESFLESTDEALSDKELNPKLRSSRTGTRTPSSPLARAVTRASPRLHMDGVLLGPPANSGVQLSLDQILSGNSGLEEGSDGQLQNPDLQNGTQFGPLSGHNAPNDMSSQSTFNLPNAAGDSLGSSADAGKGKENADNGRVKVDIVIQDFNEKDEPGSAGHGISNHDSVGVGNPGLGSTSHAPYGHPETLPVVNGEFQLHDPVDMPEIQARSFAEWMSSSAEISKLDINPLSISGEQPTSSLGTASSLLQPAGLDLLMSTTGKSLLTSKPGDVNVLTSSYTPGSSSSSEANPASPVSSTSPSATKRSTLLEKRSTLMGDILAKARGAKSSIEGGLKSSEPSSADSTSGGASVSFSAVDDVKAIEKLEESESVEDDDRPTSLTSRKELGLKRRPSGMTLSSRVRDSTNLDAPRYSIREMEDMKKNVRMELRIEITNEIKEEYERSAEQEATIYQAEIEELKAALEKEKQEKDQLKSVLDEYVSSFDDIAVSTVGEIQTLKEQNKMLTESQEETQEAFVLLKTRYDELKDLNHKHVENGEIMRKAIEVLKQDYEMSESRFESLKAHADSRMKQASQEMEQARIAYDNEIVMLKTQLGRQDMQLRTLEQALDVKTKEFEQLMQFSEDMIAKLQ